MYIFFVRKHYSFVSSYDFMLSEKCDGASCEVPTSSSNLVTLAERKASTSNHEISTHTVKWLITRIIDLHKLVKR